MNRDVIYLSGTKYTPAANDGSTGSVCIGTDSPPISDFLTTVSQSPDLDGLLNQSPLIEIGNNGNGPYAVIAFGSASSGQRRIELSHADRTRLAQLIRGAKNFIYPITSLESQWPEALGAFAFVINPWVKQQLK